MASSSPPNAFHVPKKYDVFISFRGKDTRDNFVSHLLSSLERQKRTHVFIDYKLQLGSEISEELFKAIEDSEISIIVFSENYVSSRWCLDELVKIMECKKENGHDVIPVFYHVLPSQVRNQRGSYKIAFQKHAGKPENNTAMLAKWREAMVEAANLSGKHSCKENENEAKLIEEIVKDVLCKLRSRESSGDHDQLLHDLRGKLVSKLLDEGRKTEVDTYFIERELLRRKVMVVLDDGTNAVKGMRLDMSAIRDLDLKFCPKKLGILLMPESRLRKLWDEVKDLQNLKIIDLNGSRQLKELPDFSLALNLEEIVLAGCERLCRVHSSIFSLHSLVVLNLDGCKKLKRLGGENLSEVLNLDLPSLERLSLSRSNIESLPASIKQCTKLIDLGLEDCKKLQYLPELPQSIQDLYLGRSNIERLPASIKQLTKLTKLFLTDCEKLRSLPPELPQFIKELALSGSNIESLPPSLTQLEKLTNLYLQDCNKLKSLPELPKSIELLDLSGTNNESLPPNLTQLEKLTNLYLKDCNKLKSLPELPKSIEILVLSGTDIESLPPSFTQLEKLTNLYLRDCNKLKSLPELPQSIKYLESNNCTLLVTAVTPEVFAPGGAPRGVPMINFVNCVKLDKQARCSILEKAYSSIRQIHHIDSVYEDSEEFLYACIFHICMPGSRIPKWFKHKTKTDSITIRVDQPLQIVACAYCVVLSPFPPNQGKETFFTIQCGKSISCWTLNVGRESNSCHVVLWAETFTRSTCTTSDLSFKFVVDGEINMERCGIFPIYANQGKPLDVPMDRKRKRMREE
ncbi:hypothetical protein TanjilG_28103 [Lupinus angustifolius]|uniref:TIR domain-containing protein n=1 Tax=Lupinus angustifolius TaxID=3871 RepID=A0A4P1RG95_LUPAN|nr:hypothetical protein TanjilG_28103 [Lupinus angustifolius]